MLTNSIENNNEKQKKDLLRIYFSFNHLKETKPLRYLVFISSTHTIIKSFNVSSLKDHSTSQNVTLIRTPLKFNKSEDKKKENWILKKTGVKKWRNYLKVKRTANRTVKVFYFAKDILPKIFKRIHYCRFLCWFIFVWSVANILYFQNA